MQLCRRYVFAAFSLILTGVLGVGCAHARAHAATTSDSGHGAALFAKNCSACHGASPDAGRIGPSLAGEGRKHSLMQITHAIESPDPPMPKLYPGSLSEQDVADLAAYVKNL
jgi:mono/diheme cytochrome c family protein